MGNMIGSGVFLLPASLAPYGGLSLVGWLVSAARRRSCLALVFARLARFRPVARRSVCLHAPGVRDLAGFLVAWGYWISIWTANAALAVAFVGYLDPFVPSVVRNPMLAASLAVGDGVAPDGDQLPGMRVAGRVQIVTTVAEGAAAHRDRHRRRASPSSRRNSR